MNNFACDGYLLGGALSTLATIGVAAGLAPGGAEPKSSPHKYAPYLKVLRQLRKVRLLGPEGDGYPKLSYRSIPECGNSEGQVAYL